MQTSRCKAAPLERAGCAKAQARGACRTQKEPVQAARVRHRSALYRGAMQRQDDASALVIW
ncbi:hypothetical protein BVV20_09860 [Xanthomonas oryzae pv. oryzae]|nr:hypothetical protein BVV20_09860 [Xanthomonas oryzae pv. oryzae]